MQVVSGMHTRAFEPPELGHHTCSLLAVILVGSSYRLPVTPSPLHSVSALPKSLRITPLINVVPVTRTFGDNSVANKVRAAYGETRQVWLENLDTVQEQKLDILDLHPDVFAVYPRIDFIHENIVWQNKYKDVNYNHVKNRYEMVSRYGELVVLVMVQSGPPSGSTEAKLTARAARSLCTTCWEYHKRVYGLTHTLSAKFVQDDVHVVNNLDIPTDDSEYLL